MHQDHLGIHTNRPNPTNFMMMMMMMMMIFYITAGWQLNVYKTFHNMAVITLSKIFWSRKMILKALWIHLMEKTTVYAKHVDIVNPSMKYIIYMALLHLILTQTELQFNYILFLKCCTLVAKWRVITRVTWFHKLYLSTLTLKISTFY